MPCVRRIANDNRETLVTFDAIYSVSLVGECGGIECKTVREILGWFQCVGEIYAGAFITAKSITGLVKLEADFHMGDGVWGHHQLVAVKAGEQMFWTIVVT